MLNLIRNLFFGAVRYAGVRVSPSRPSPRWRWEDWVEIPLCSYFSLIGHLYLIGVWFGEDQSTNTHKEINILQNQHTRYALR